MSYFDDHEEDYGYDYTPRGPVVCKYCDASDVEWLHTGVRWRLIDSSTGRPHNCPRIASVDDFEVIG